MKYAGLPEGAVVNASAPQQNFAGLPEGAVVNPPREEHPVSSYFQGIMSDPVAALERSVFQLGAKGLDILLPQEKNLSSIIAPPKTYSEKLADFLSESNKIAYGDETPKEKQARELGATISNAFETAPMFAESKLLNLGRVAPVAKTAPILQRAAVTGQNALRATADAIANRAPGAAIAGATAPANDANDLMKNMAVSTGLGVGIPAAFSGAGTLFRSLVKGGELTPLEEAAMKSGYTLPPATMKNPSKLSAVLGGWAGKVKSQQGASALNQDVTNRLGATELNLSEDTLLNENTYNKVIKDAGTAYQAVKDAIPTIQVNPAFQKTVADAGSKNSILAKDFPELVKNSGVSDIVDAFAKKTSFSTDAGIEAVKTLRQDATANLQAIGDPQKHALGRLQRQYADAIDQLIEDNLAGNPATQKLVPQYKDARQLIAKAYDLKAATNLTTGDISAAKLASIGRKKPFTGNLNAITDMANAFPRSVQSPANFGGVEPLSTLDTMGAVYAAGTGNYGAAGALLGKPAVRGVTLSKPYQQYVLDNMATTGLKNSKLTPVVNALSQYQRPNYEDFK